MIRRTRLFVFAFFGDATASSVDPLRPFTRLACRIVHADFREESVFAQFDTETGAQQRSEAARMGRGGACRAVRAARCASLLTWLALVARAEGEVATYSGTSDVIPESPRFASIPESGARRQRDTPSRRAIAGERPSRSLSRASISAHRKTPTLLPRRVPHRVRPERPAVQAQHVAVDGAESPPRQLRALRGAAHERRRRGQRHGRTRREPGVVPRGMGGRGLLGVPVQARVSRYRRRRWHASARQGVHERVSRPHRRGDVPAVAVRRGLGGRQGVFVPVRR